MNLAVAGAARPSASTPQKVELSVGPIWPFGRTCSRARSAGFRAPSASSASATIATSFELCSVASCERR
jgi:hypothetical protein